jgi:hypothetical protein
MLIDINAYVGHWPFMQLKYNTCESLAQRMDGGRTWKPVSAN